MLHFNFNGKILEENTAITGENSRATRYGDGVFETIKYKNGTILLADEHFARLWKGMQQLKFEQSKHFTTEKLTEEIIQLLKKNKHSSARIRLSIYRGDGGLYDAKNNQPNYLIQTWQLTEDTGLLNGNGLQLCIYKDAQKNCDSFSNIKHNNYLPYFMGAFFAKENKCNDALILNNHLRICDSTIANIFLVKNSIIYTPELTEGCVAGIMRKFIIKCLADSNFKVTEQKIEISDVMEADEIFLSNSIYNIRWVAGIADKVYGNEIVQQVDQYLRQTNGQVFC